jgi:hypothetical protein
MAGGQAEVIKMTGAGSGEIAGSLAQAFPSKALASIQSELEMSVTTAGQSQGVVVKTDIQTTLDSE